MCGIAGLCLAGGGPVDEGTLRAMIARLAHRGPDGEGIFVAPGVGLGHRRLSILDLSAAAAQPMRAGPGVLSYNGEIYNFAALRRRLAGAEPGEPFRSHGDTEVLLRALLRSGRDALPWLHGMFAFAYWDSSRRTLLLARDRYGEKPLYYAPLGPEGREGIAFASELRALLAVPRLRAEARVDPVAVAQLLAHEYVPAPRSILAGARKLRPGEWLTWEDSAAGRGVLRVGSYHLSSLGEAPRLAGEDPEALLRELQRLVEESVRERLVADVPVGVFLSGGLDSSLVAACAQRVHGGVRTFCVRFEDQSFDESAHARRVAAHLGTEHTEVPLSEGEMLATLPATLDFMDEPLSDSSLLPTTLLARATREHVKVALGGDGGDELLLGYPTFLVDEYLGWLPPLPAGAAGALRALAGRWPPGDGNFSLGFKLRQLSQGLGDKGARRHAGWLAPLVPAEIAALGTAELQAASGQVWEAIDAAGALGGDDRAAAEAFYLRCYLGEGVLTKVDRATMRASLEARAPLLAPEVVDFCLGLPRRLRLRGLRSKWLMRRLLSRLVPPEIAARPKKGFGAPVGAWLRGPLRPLLLDTLTPDALRRAGWVRPAAVRQLIDEHLSGRRDHRKPLYALLVLHHFHARWLG